MAWPKRLKKMPGPVILEFWKRGVEPKNLRYELIRALPRHVWRATVVPAWAIYKSFR